MKTLRDFHEDSMNFVRTLYASNEDPEYDMVPQMMLVNDEGMLIVCALAGDANPMDMASLIVRSHKPAMISFISSIWRKDPETNTKRIGEGVMIISETEKERLGAIFEVKREPNPVLTEPPMIQMDSMTARVRLLYNPNHTEH